MSKAIKWILIAGGALFVLVIAALFVMPDGSMITPEPMPPIPPRGMLGIRGMSLKKRRNSGGKMSLKRSSSNGELGKASCVCDCSTATGTFLIITTAGRTFWAASRNANDNDLA